MLVFIIANIYSNIIIFDTNYVKKRYMHTKESLSDQSLFYKIPTFTGEKLWQT